MINTFYSCTTRGYSRRLALFLGLLILVAACVPTDSSEQDSLTLADTESTSPTVEAPTPTSEATATTEAIPTAATESQEIGSTAPIDITKQLPVGDPQNGEALLTAKACAGCHLIDAIGAGPSWKAANYANGIGIGQRAQERWQQPEYGGQATNATEYLVESIVMPNAYVINGYMKGTMPNTYGELLTEQERADIIAFLLEIE